MQEWVETVTEGMTQHLEECAARRDEAAQNLALWRDDIIKALSGAPFVMRQHRLGWG